MPLSEISELFCPNWAGSTRKRTEEVQHPTDTTDAEDELRKIMDELEDLQPQLKKMKRGERIVQYTGEEGRERLFRIEFWDGSMTYFTGERGHEHKKLSRMPTKDLPAHKPYIVHYEGPKGAERIVRTVSQNGNRCFFQGLQRNERLVRIESASGKNTVHYHGPKGEERKWKLESDSGTEFYTGAQGYERRVRTVYHNGRMQHYQGAKGHEKTWRVLHPDGQIDIYDTTTDAARSKIQFSIFPTGRMQHHTSGRTNPAHVLEQKQQAMKECIHNAQESLRELSESGDINEGALLKMSSWFQAMHDNFLACKSTNTLILVDEGETTADREGLASEMDESAEDEEEDEEEDAEEEEGDAAYREEVARGFVGIPPAMR